VIRAAQVIAYGVNKRLPSSEIYQLLSNKLSFSFPQKPISPKVLQRQEYAAVSLSV
jgi:hypothetical protein